MRAKQIPRIDIHENIKICGDNLTPEQEEEFYNTFGNIADGISVERAIEYWPKCGVMKQGVPEDIDEFAAEILDNM